MGNTVCSASKNERFLFPHDCIYRGKGFQRSAAALWCPQRLGFPTLHLPILSCQRAQDDCAASGSSYTCQAGGRTKAKGAQGPPLQYKKLSRKPHSAPALLSSSARTRPQSHPQLHKQGAGMVGCLSIFGTLLSPNTTGVLLMRKKWGASLE